MNKMLVGFAMFWLTGAMVVGCAAGAPPSSTPHAGADAPCAPSDCAPCDETKGKCTGPSVCDGHPERAKRVCARGSDGTCQSRLVCE